MPDITFEQARQDVLNRNTVARAFEAARADIRANALEAGQDEADARVAEFNRALALFESAAWNRGREFAHGVEQRAARRAAAGLVLQVLGKDRADGVIDLGALGRWYPNAGDTGPEQVRPL